MIMSGKVIGRARTPILKIDAVKPAYTVRTAVKARRMKVAVAKILKGIAIITAPTVFSITAPSGISLHRV
jgi:hypothetical protein